MAAKPIRRMRVTYHRCRQRALPDSEIVHVHHAALALRLDEHPVDVAP
jgi:hypothetical protein